MSMIHDIIKIRFSELGYLPNIPYHLISDDEMCDAFILRDPQDKPCYFYDYYPCVDDSLKSKYDALVEAIHYHIDQFKQSSDPNKALPLWIYSYMNGATIGPQSDPLDIHDLILPLGCDNMDDEFNIQCANACYNASQAWLMKTTKRYAQLEDGTTIDTRPPTIFGEPHVVKYVRLLDVRG